PTRQQRAGSGSSRCRPWRSTVAASPGWCSATARCSRPGSTRRSRRWPPAWPRPGCGAPELLVVLVRPAAQAAGLHPDDDAFRVARDHALGLLVAAVALGRAAQDAVEVVGRDRGLGAG